MRQHLQDFKLIRPLTWPEVFDFWEENEGRNPQWLKVARDHGFDSWKEWRGSYVAPAKLDQRNWNLYRVIRPPEMVPAFRGGPFRAWVEQIYSDAGFTPLFAEIAKRLVGQKNGRVEEIRASFSEKPQRTIITGILTDPGIVIMEGMHRCAAIALAAADGTPMEIELLIALGGSLPGDAELLASKIGGHRKGESAVRD